MDIAVEQLAVMKNVTNAMQVLATTLAVTAWMWPKQALIQDGAKYDYIVVGAGTAGSIVANRLTEDPSVRVLVIEAGGDAPIESVFPAYFPFLPRTINDWQYQSVKDDKTAQHNKRKSIELTSGKLLGGSSSLHHLIHSRGHPDDYNAWAEAANDDTWKYDNLLKYFNKFENLLDQEVLNSPNGRLYGTDGYIKLTKEHNNITDRYLDAFKEIGHNIVVDSNGYDTLGYTEPVMYIADGARQGSAEGYLTKVKDRPNFDLIKHTLVSKVIIDNGVAIGVEALNNNIKYTFYVTKEVIVSAGALNSPKLLMLSGIGPENHLNDLGIDLVSNLPVGRNLQDHPSVKIVHKMGPSSGLKEPANPHKFSFPQFIGYASLQRKGVPDYQTINLIFPYDSKEIFQLCAALFNYDDALCEAFYSASKGSEAFVTVMNILNPVSRGIIELKSNNPEDDPIVYLGNLSDETDVEKFADCIEDWLVINTSTLFTSVKAEIVDLRLPECQGLVDRDFIKCYVKGVGNSLWHYSGTCAMGSVVDNELKVIGIENLRVADASVIPKLISGNICGPIMAIAEKAADLVKEKNSGK